jgi:hypothetical protein
MCGGLCCSYCGEGMCKTLSRGFVSPVLGGSGGLDGGRVSSIALVFPGVEGVAVGIGASSSSASSCVGSGSGNFFSEVDVLRGSVSFANSSSRRCGAGSNALP